LRETGSEIGGSSEGMMKKWTLALAILLAGEATQAASLLDTTFDIGSGADGFVEQVLQQPDGKVLVCGIFTTFNGQPKAFIARLNANGSVDTTFTGRPSYWVRHMALQTDGKIVIGGYFTRVDDQPRNRIARLNANGSLDTTFDPGLGMEVIIAQGIDGGADPFVFWQEIQADGKIVATGNFRYFNGASATGIVRINPNGSLDTTFNFGQGLDSWGRVVKILPNQQILVGGWFTSYNGSGGHRLVRINPDGTRDSSLNPYYGDKTAVYSIAVQPDGKLITSGHSLNEEGIFQQDVVRLNLNGSFDLSWVGHTNDKTECLYLQPDGKLILSGYFNQLNGITRRSIGRLNADGTIDSAFAADADNFVWSIAPANNNKIYVAGGFTTIDGISRRSVARLIPPASSGGTIGLPPAPMIASARFNTNKFECTVNTVANRTYVLQFKPSIEDSQWTALPSITGNGFEMILTDLFPKDGRIYRVEAR
jgi:uncharacterized delta-60 repeat protein